MIDAGLPKPVTQIPVYRGWKLIGLLDMGWKDYLVAAEYDGDQHRADRKQFVRDIERYAELESMGWAVIRVVAEHRPDDVVRRVRDTLLRRGYRPEPGASPVG
jgi:very-short-patch-repair endonuclease